jgi:sugar/nucleoside kinase (ribokinase family)
MATPTNSAVNRPRIVTLTMNPALDITTGAQHVGPTDKVRCHGVRYDPGGGGINVARIARVLGAPVSAVFPAGGPTGDALADLLIDSGVLFHRVKIAGNTRESFTINDESTGEQYRFVLEGPRLTFAEQAQCLDELRMLARTAEFVVASGSLPRGVPADFYQRVADVCRSLDTLLILDTSGGGLQHISTGVFLLKAGVRELRERTGCELATESESSGGGTRAHSTWPDPSRCGITRRRRRAASHPVGESAVFGDRDAAGQRRRRRRRDGGCYQRRPDSRLAAGEVGASRYRRGGCNAVDARDGCLQPGRRGAPLGTGRRAGGYRCRHMRLSGTG